jgi:hypothetical protein
VTNNPDNSNKEDSSIDSDDEKKTLDEADKKILDEAHARFAISEKAESEIRISALEDIEFSAGNQWPSSIKSEREQDQRPCLTINKVEQSVKQVCNDQRQNRPSIKVHPVDDKGDIETAKIMQGLIRHIEYDSNADAAYDTGFEAAVRGGFGFIRIVTEYESPTSFNQSIKIKRVNNQFSARLDPHSQEPDGSDANWGFISEDISKDEYKRTYPKSEAASSDGWESIGSQSPGWINDDCCRVTEYFYKEFEDKEICLLSNGDVVFKDKLEDALAHLNQDPNAQVSVVKERTAQVPVVKWCKLNGIEILEKTDWPGSYIPIIPVYGQELNINGKRTLQGIVRSAKDPARMYNYWKSAETEAIALAPRTPFILAEGQVEGYEHFWNSANRKNHAYLPYKPMALNGTQVPPPQRNSIETSIGAITQASMGASDDIKATTGIYDASLGKQSNETSGVAIQRRNNQAQTSNFHFVDNLTRSLRHAGRVIIDLIPKIYDTARAARIIGEDGVPKIVKLNETFDDNGKPTIYAMDAGRYDAIVDVGPSFASKRQEAAASMIDMSRSNPAIMQSAGDLVVRNMDWPGAQDIADRLKKTLPPGLADDDKSKAPPIPPQMQQQMQQQGHMIEQLTEQLHKLHDERDQKLIELESRERIEFKKLEVQLEIKRAELDAKDSHALLSLEIDQINQRLKYLDINQPIQYESDESQSESQENQQFNPNPNGAPSADQGSGQQEPTGGFPPGQPLEGNSNEQQ